MLVSARKTPHWQAWLAAAILGCHGGMLRERYAGRCADGGSCSSVPACEGNSDERTDCSELLTDPLHDSGSRLDAGGTSVREPNISSGPASPKREAGTTRPDSDAEHTLVDGGTNAGVVSDGSAPQGDGGPSLAATCEGEQAQGPSSEGPEASIAFPPPRSYTDATTMIVRGSARDRDGVLAVSVNGIPATSSDGFASWSATLPINSGCNTLRVSATDMRGNESTNAALAIVRNHGRPLQGVAVMDLDVAHNRLIVAGLEEGIATVDLTSGRVGSLTSAPVLREGVKPAMIVDAVRDRALLVVRGTDVVHAVDLSRGTSSELVTATSDPTLRISEALALALDASGTTVFATVDYPSRIIAIDLQTGARRIVASDAVGSGPSVTGGVELIFDAVTSQGSPRLLMGVPTAGQILAIDPSTGARSVLTGTGAALLHPARMRLDPARRRLLVVDGEVSATEAAFSALAARNDLIAIDLDTGVRNTLATATGAPSEPSLTSSFALAVDPSAQVAYVAGELDGQITRIDLTSGARRTCAESNMGVGPRLRRPTGVSLAGDTLWLVDHPRHAVVRIDRRTGDRSDLDGAAQLGGGLGLNEPVAMVLDGPADAPGRAFVVGLEIPALWSIELDKGTRKLISTPTPGMLSTRELIGIALDRVNQRVLLTDSTTPFNARTFSAIDLATGARTLISGPMRGAGPMLSGTGVVFDPGSSPARALVIGGSLVFSVDLGSGDRTVVSPAQTVGTGMLQGALDPKGGRLISNDYGQGVVEVDLANGRRKLLVSARDGSGPPIILTSLAVDFTQQVGYATSEYGHSLMALDLLADQRVILSR